MLHAVANPPDGFEYQVIGGNVVIRHRGRRATTLRGAAASSSWLR
jgi:hypothetical protein